MRGDPWPEIPPRLPEAFPGTPAEIPAHASRFFFHSCPLAFSWPWCKYTCGMTGPQEDRWGKGLHRLRQSSDDCQGPMNPE